MIASTMLYLAAVSVAASVAALAAWAGLRRLGVPGRWAWLVAMLLPGALLALRSVGSVPRPAGLVAPIALPAIAVTSGAGGLPWGAWLETALAIVWIVGSAAIAVVLLRGQLVLARERRAARPRFIEGELVHVTARRGPAVAGFLQPWIAVPEWVLELPDDQLRMVVAHEAEHVRAGDSRVVGAALAVVAATFWNPLAWWQLGRLRTAVELDCDRRVLAAERDLRAYGSALLAVAAGAVPERSLGLAAFSENAYSLRTRILAMTSRRARWARPVGIAFLLAGVALAIQACGLDSPVSPIGQSRNTVPMPAGKPSFTPFSVAPNLTNAPEVIQALKDNYPTLLKEAGIEGRADVWLNLDATGKLIDVQLNRSTGHEALDIAAIKVGWTMKFTPALSKDKPVPVWVSVPITFKGTPPPPEQK